MHATEIAPLQPTKKFDYEAVVLGLTKYSKI